MVNEKKNTNDFSFVLYDEKGNKIVERRFNGDCFNPTTRYYVDIRYMIPEIIKRLESKLSSKHLNYKESFGVGYDENDEKQYKDYDYLGHFKSVSPTPSYFSRFVSTKKEAELKFGLYINNNTIVERNIYISNYNPASRYSVELIEAVRGICDDIYLHLKRQDVTNMWDDFEIITTYGLHISQIRDFTYKQKQELLKKRSNRQFVSKIRSKYRKSNNSNQQQSAS
jgi:hypothetical protein